MKKRILFVDDEPNVLASIERMLHSQINEWDMTFSTSSAEATELLARESFDVVVLDVNMPGKNGLQLLSEIKSEARTRNIEAVVITGAQDDSLKRQALETGAADLLNKPVVKEDLVARLQSALRMKSDHDLLDAQNRILLKQLIQAQRMEVVGVLAAGVTPDFKSILNAIKLYTEYTSRYLEVGPEAKENLGTIIDACERGNKIVDQILAFTETPANSRELCYIDDLIDKSLTLVRHLAQHKITIEYSRPSTNFVIHADSTLVCQLLLNLCINALLAMEDGGVIKISLSEAADPVVDPTQINHEIHRGNYLELAVTDTGKAFDEDLLADIDDSLFTITEAAPAETSLRLFVVQHIVRDLGGWMKVECTQETGNTFHVYLPGAKKR